jgi:hypothetical protein
MWEEVQNFFVAKGVRKLTKLFFWLMLELTRITHNQKKYKTIFLSFAHTLKKKFGPEKKHFFIGFRLKQCADL